MANFVKPADRLKGHTLNDGWKVTENFVPRFGSRDNSYSSCYIVEKGNIKGFLKAFDYSGLLKAGGQDKYKKLNYKYHSELSMLKKCQSKDIKSVVKLLANDRYFFKPDDINELVEYFILEYSEDGNVHECLLNGSLLEFKNRFQALIDVFDGLNSLHLNGIMHLDIKADNILHFVNDRLTKITDFGSARQLITDIDEELVDELDNIGTTRQYAPPECLYNDFWTSDWNEYRRKVDLYLIGNVIVKLFTNFSFTTLLKKEITEFDDWNNQQNVGKGRLKQFLPHLITGAANVYVAIEEKLYAINDECGRPLDANSIMDMMKVISQLCNPDAEKRGHPLELARKNNKDGLDRYRDKFITLRDLCVANRIMKA